LEHNSKQKDRSPYIVSTSHQYEPVGITIDCFAVMASVSSDSLYLGKRVLRQKKNTFSGHRTKYTDITYDDKINYP
jgi:hypothetical protein